MDLDLSFLVIWIVGRLISTRKVCLIRKARTLVNGTSIKEKALFIKLFFVKYFFYF